MKKKSKRRKQDRLGIAAFLIIICLFALGGISRALSNEGRNAENNVGDQQQNGAVLGQNNSPTENNIDSIEKNQLENSGKLGFHWSDSEISNRLSVNSKGQIEWKSLRGYPMECPDGQAIKKIGDRVECIDVGSSDDQNQDVAWQSLSDFPSGCPDGQAIQVIGDTLTCADIDSGENLFTDGGETTYLSSLTENLAVGGSDSTAPFFFDADTDILSVSELESGGSSDNLSVSNEGFLELNGNATVWEDLRVPVTSTTRDGSKQPAFGVFKNDGGTSQGVFTFWFDPASEQELYFTAQIPHNYKLGSNIYPHVHWIPDSNGSSGQKVSWGLEYTWANIGSVFGDTNIVYANTTYPNETLSADKQYMTGFSAISGTNKSYSSMLVCRIFRNATGAGGSTDDYADDAGLMEIDFHYEIDKLGTDDEY